MNINSLALLAIAVALVTCPQLLRADDLCPRTIGASEVFPEPWPRSKSWYGSESLAVMLPENGIWPTTVPGNRLAVKLFWYSKEFQATADLGFDGGEHLGFNARIRRLDPGPNDAKISSPNWAGLGGLGDNWTILTGIDFPSPGCWEITGEYRDQSLSFVVQTVDYTELRDRRDEY